MSSVMKDKSVSRLYMASSSVFWFTTEVEISQ
jgi:hypothetical protein